jgi:hypothetical protein
VWWDEKICGAPDAGPVVARDRVVFSFRGYFGVWGKGVAGGTEIDSLACFETSTPVQSLEVRVEPH